MVQNHRRMKYLTTPILIAAGLGIIVGGILCWNNDTFANALRPIAEKLPGGPSGATLESNNV